jgi:hypothetical protein
MNAKRGAKKHRWRSDECPEVQGDGFPRDTNTKAETLTRSRTNKQDQPPSRLFFYVESLQITLNSSLKRTLHVYGHTTALCAEMGVLPLRLTQQVQLVQLHFRQTQVYKDSIPGTLYDITMSLFQDLPPQAMEKLMKQAQNHLHPQSAPNPPQVNQALPGNKEKSYKNWLRVQARGRCELMNFKSRTQAPGRFQAYDDDDMMMMMSFICSCRNKK